MSVAPPPPGGFEVAVETLIVGAGACGLTAALAAAEAGQEVLVIERDPVPSGSTALSAGLIPAAGTRFQRDRGIDDDDAALFAADLQAKAKGQNPPELVAALARGAGPAVEWLAERHGLNFTVVHDFDYPGHSRRRMHGLPSRAGADLVDALRAACERAGIPIVCGAAVETLFATPEGRIVGVERGDAENSRDRIGCARLILACNGFGGNPEMLARLIPEIAGGIYFGHTGNRGDALDWGAALGAATRHLSAYQGHGNVAHPHGILISWAVITEGGYQVNTAGDRFWNEAQGYSESARAVLAQPEGIAVTVFDARIAAVARQFADFVLAEERGAIRTADSIAALAAQFGLPEAALTATHAEIGGLHGPDRFGRDWAGVPRLQPPFCGVRVTGTLFHTQGGLDITPEGRVKRADGGVFPNLFAAGGAAVGVSGAGDAGYLSGNGLLAAVTMGRIAGMQPVPAADA